MTTRNRSGHDHGHVRLHTLAPDCTDTCSVVPQRRALPPACPCAVRIQAPPFRPLHASMAQVNATSTAMEFVVRGGGWGDDVWVPPNVTEVEDNKFIPSLRSDMRFQRYVLAPPPHTHTPTTTWERGPRQRSSPSTPSWTACRSCATQESTTFSSTHIQDQDPIANIDIVQTSARKDMDPAELTSTGTIELPAVYFGMQH